MNTMITCLLPGFPARTHLGVMGFSSVLLIRTSQKNILFDCGVHGSVQKLKNALCECGLTPDDIDQVVISHLHFDHVGNLPMFKNAEFLISQKEWENARTQPDEWVCEACVSYLQQYGKIKFVKEGNQLDRGVVVWELPGHTEGSIGLMVETSDGKIVLAGDALKNRYEYDAGECVMPVNCEKGKKSIQRIKAEADIIYQGHDCAIDMRADTEFSELSLQILYANGVIVNAALENE